MWESRSAFENISLTVNVSTILAFSFYRRMVKQIFQRQRERQFIQSPIGYVRIELFLKGGSVIFGFYLISRCLPTTVIRNQSLVWQETVPIWTQSRHKVSLKRRNSFEVQETHLTKKCGVHDVTFCCFYAMAHFHYFDMVPLYITVHTGEGTFGLLSPFPSAPHSVYS